MASFLRLTLVSVLAGLTVGPSAGMAQSPADFYKGKTVGLVVSTAAGGPYDIAARLVARYLPRYIPDNPAVVVRNMPGAGSMRATNYLYNQASRDGLTIGTVVNTIVVHQAIGGQGAMYDARKFGWIGSIGQSNLTLYVVTKAGIKSVQDAKQREVVLGATGPGSGTYIYAHAITRSLARSSSWSQVIRATRRSTSPSNAAKSRGRVARATRPWCTSTTAETA